MENEIKETTEVETMENEIKETTEVETMENEIKETTEVETMDELEEMPLGIVDEEIEEVKEEV